MEVSNIITIILFIISCVSIIISIVTFIKNGNKEVKADTSKDSYKWGQLDEKLNNLEKQVNKILDKLDTFELEVETKIEKALEMLAELKKSSKRWFVISIILLVALVVSNIGWLIYESQWEEVTETQTIEQHQDDTDNSNMS